MKHAHNPVEPPLQHIYDLGDLTQAGADVAVEADADQRAAIAKWADVAAVKRFAAAVTLRRLSQTRFNFEADLTADIVQACVVTLEPVEAQITRHIGRELHLAPRLPRGEESELTLAAGDDDVPETILSLDYDLAAPLLEEFALALDPYPRKPGAAFEAPAEPEPPQSSPFAVLKALKDRD